MDKFKNKKMSKYADEVAFIEIIYRRKSIRALGRNP
jgi:hypothetical protein